MEKYPENPESEEIDQRLRKLDGLGALEMKWSFFIWEGQYNTVNSTVAIVHAINPISTIDEYL